MKSEIDKSSLLSQWKKQKRNTPTLLKINKAPLGEAIPLSKGQQRLWFLQQLYPNNSFYNHAESYTILGELNFEFLSNSFDLIIEEQESLRSYFPIEDGQTTIKIASDFKLKINTVDFSTFQLDEAKQKVNDFIAEEIILPFNLNAAPLTRVSLLKLTEENHILSINIHHIIIDEWSMRHFINSLAEYYTKLSKGETIQPKELPIQYQDYAYWDQHRTLPTKQVDYWKHKLSGTIPVLELPTDYKRPLQPSYEGAHYSSLLSKEDSEGLLAFSKQMETTPFVVTLTIFYTLLYRYTNQKDILIGLPFTNRKDKSLQDLLGFFVDTIVLRTQFNEDNSFKELLSKVRKNTLDAFSNNDIPFNYLVNELLPSRSLSMNPFFQVMFVFNSDEKTSSNDYNIDFKKRNDIHLKSSKFDLTLFINEKDGQLATTLEYATDLFDESTIERFSAHFNNLVKAVISNSDNSIAELPMLTSDEKMYFSKDNSSSNHIFKNFTGIHHIIEDIAKKNPDTIAVTFGSEKLSYKDLDKRATALAHSLLARKNVNDKIVGLSIKRSTDMIVGLLAILKSGCAYLPIDPDYPSQRIDFILKDADINCIITQQSLSPIFSEFKTDIITIETVEDINDTNKKLPLASNTDLAYVIYTSGSTGNPKGVPITQKNIINSTAGRLAFYDNNPTAFLLMSSISFDSSKAGIFWTLCTGGNLVISEQRLEQDIDGIAKIIEANKISHTLMLPSLYHLILEHSNTAKLNSLTTVMVAGEACSVAVARKHFLTLPNTDLYNEYGPTEATVWCIAHKVSELDIEHNKIPIGKSVANANVHILNSNLKPVPFGVTGELYISGTSLAGYYINRPDLTEKAYRKNEKNITLYKTGDLVKYNTDGNIEFLGRADQQVKIRGYRVELNEIETVLNENKMVKKAVVVAETTNKNISSIDTNTAVEASELAQILIENLDSVEIKKLLHSVEVLDTNDKAYLFKQLK
ncbi:non-ribosomal peptide synthetase [Winogradskyella sp. 4-2091]|uniref:non-ribosomal peptide synthetase n=1 Tax=Winogradskyella sp. 4-2091 TaxID=3381659 RepID=UPI003892399F